MNRLEALLAWYGTLTPQSLARIAEFYHPQARFKDPFNDVQGAADIRRVFAHMFTSTEAPRFIIREEIAEPHRAFVTWDFTFTLRGRRFVVHGATRFGFDHDGRVTEHRDYWDPAEELWQKLPVIGAPVAWLRRRFQAR
jgi:ketosteroid isomerase-like protein